MKRFFGFLDGIKNSPSSPPTFSEPFPVSDRFISCQLLANTLMDVTYFV